MEVPTEKDVSCDGENGNYKEGGHEAAEELPSPFMLEATVKVIPEAKKEIDLEQDIKEKKERKNQYSSRKIH